MHKSANSGDQPFYKESRDTACEKLRDVSGLDRKDTNRHCAGMQKLTAANQIVENEFGGLTIVNSKHYVPSPPPLTGEYPAASARIDFVDQVEVAKNFNPLRVNDGSMVCDGQGRVEWLRIGREGQGCAQYLSSDGIGRHKVLKLTVASIGDTNPNKNSEIHFMRRPDGRYQIEGMHPPHGFDDLIAKQETATFVLIQGNQVVGQIGREGVFGNIVPRPLPMLG